MRKNSEGENHEEKCAENGSDGRTLIDDNAPARNYRHLHQLRVNMPDNDVGAPHCWIHRNHPWNPYPTEIK